MRIGVLPRRYTHHTSKCTLKLMWAHARGHAEGGESQTFIAGVRIQAGVNANLDLPAHAGHGFRSRVAQLDRPWAAPQAWTETLLLRCFGKRKKLDVFAPRPPRWARRTAVNTR